MAYLDHASVRCKNKLCAYTGTIRFYSHEKVSLVCPTCGFKTLERYYPEIEKIFREAKKNSK